ncbi:MAG: HEAT repeat domain-containing protein [Anaerolineae bacterium]|nr:HEAT repeat domain-containing protein [Anaerolineae bacterium]
MDFLRKLFGRTSENESKQGGSKAAKDGGVQTDETRRDPNESPDRHIEQNAPDRFILTPIPLRPTPSVHAMERELGGEETEAGSNPLLHEFGTAKSADVQTLLADLGRRDILGKNPALEQLRRMGQKAVPYLLEILEHSDDVPKLADTINVLGELGIEQAVPKLKRLSQSQWAEVAQAALTALAVLDKTTTLRADPSRLNDQIGQLWTAIVQSHKTLYPPDVLKTFCAEAAAALPKAPDRELSGIWLMLGSLTYKSFYPEDNVDHRNVKSCPEAKGCYEQALRCDALNDTAKMFVRAFTTPESALEGLPPGEDPDYNGKSMRQWLKILADSKSGREDRKQAVEALRDIGAPAVPGLMQIFKLEEQLAEDMTFLSGDCIETILSVGKPAVPALSEFMADQSSRLFISSAYVLGKIGETSVATPVLISVIEDAERKAILRAQAAEALGKIGPAVVQDASPVLIKALKDEDPIIRSSAAKGLRYLESPEAVDPLIDALQDRYAFVRQSASVALRGFFRAVQAEPSIVDKLIELVESKAEKGRDEAVSLLGEIKDERAVKTLKNALKEKELAFGAAAALRNITGKEH